VSVAEADIADLSPEEQSKSLVRAEYDKLVAQSDFFGWQLRLHDAGDYYVIFVRIEKSPERVFVLMLECDDYAQQSPRATFIDPELFESANETTKPEAKFHPTGEKVELGRGPLPVMCIKGHRDYYGGWHGGWTNPPEHDHSLRQHVVNVRNAILDIWS
jgi:hypothetical protein